MNAPRVIDELRAIIGSLRVLAPDHEMEAQRPEAVQWVEDRVESSWALASNAVKIRSTARATLASVEQSVQRSFFAASSENAYPQPFERRTMAIDRRRLGLPDAPSRERPEVRWSRSMSAVFDAWLLRAKRPEAATVFDPVVLARARVAQAYGSRGHLAFMLSALCSDTDDLRVKIQENTAVSLFAYAAVECAIDHCLWKALFEEPSPLGPWIELWQRGLWPCWGDDGVAHVFNPIRGEHGAVVEPEDECAKVPRFDGRSMLPLSHAPACALDVALTWDGASVCIAPLVIERERLGVGRGRTMDVWIGNPTVARRHMDIERAGSRWVARDLNSTNGVVLRGEYAKESVALAGGELLMLGACALLYVGSAA